MEKNLLAKLASLTTVFLVVPLIVNQILNSAPSITIWLNSTGSSSGVLVSFESALTAFASGVSGVLGLAALIKLIQKFFEGRRWKKKYGESRTPVVVKAKEPADN